MTNRTVNADLPTPPAVPEEIRDTLGFAVLWERRTSQDHDPIFPHGGSSAARSADAVYERVEAGATCERDERTMRCRRRCGRRGRRGRGQSQSEASRQTEPDLPTFPSLGARQPLGVSHSLSSTTTTAQTKRVVDDSSSDKGKCTNSLRRGHSHGETARLLRHCC